MFFVRTLSGDKVRIFYVAAWKRKWWDVGGVVHLPTEEII